MRNSRSQPPGLAIKTADITRGAERLLQSLGYATLVEFSPGNGRRIDIAGIARGGQLAFVEVKASLGDFRHDRKWPQYLDYCDALYFAVAVDFPLRVLDQPAVQPRRPGIIVADRYGGDIHRRATIARMNPARRRAETLRFAHRAADRLNRKNLAAGQRSRAENLV